MICVIIFLKIYKADYHLTRLIQPTQKDARLISSVLAEPHRGCSATLHSPDPIRRECPSRALPTPAIYSRYAALRENKSLERSNCHDNRNASRFIITAIWPLSSGVMCQSLLLNKYYKIRNGYFGNCYY